VLSPSKKIDDCIYPRQMTTETRRLLRALLSPSSCIPLPRTVDQVWLSWAISDLSL